MCHGFVCVGAVVTLWLYSPILEEQLLQVTEGVSLQYTGQVVFSVTVNHSHHKIVTEYLHKSLKLKKNSRGFI